MDNNSIQKGSQWRKWDLHVHTPASFHWKGTNLLHDMSLEEIEESFHQLLRTIENSDVAVFCFMDYWTFDGYLRFNHYLQCNNLNCSKTIFPGMELRIEAPVDYRLNIQVILSNLLSPQQLDDFRSELIVRSIDRRISDEAIIEFAKSLDASKAKVHGYGDPKTLSLTELLQLGSLTIEVTQNSLSEAIKTLPRGTAYIILPYDTSDGLLKLDWKTQPHADNYFMQTAHIFESRKDETIDLFLGRVTEKNQSFIENFQKTLNNVQKPVICGSDAHSYSDYGKFPGNKATWIKADPTFEGFKQIIYEPHERVQIQELQPNEKIPYRVLDKIRFVDNTGRNFSSDWINLNENLNAIIGGKSSGKSLLLYHIAKTVAPNLVEERKKEVQILDYKFGSSQDFDFEVQWKDGHCDKLSDPSNSNVREIEYIPQLYVNALAEKQGRNSLYKLIESILEQNTDYREYIKNKRQEIQELEDVIDQNLSELLRRREELKSLQEERKMIGEEKAIKKEIERLTSAIEKLRKDSSLTEEETSKYSHLLRLRVMEGKRNKKFEELKRTIDSFTLVLEQTKNQVIQILENFNPIATSDSFSKRVLSLLKSTATKAISESIDLLISSQNILAQLASNKAQKCDSNQKKILQELQPYSIKINDQTKLKDLEAKLIDQNKILDAYEQKTMIIDSVIRIGHQTRNNLFTKYASLLSCYKDILNNLKKYDYSNIDEDIVLEATLCFDTSRFSDLFADLFDRRSRLKTIFGSAFNENDEFQFEESQHNKVMEDIFAKLSKTNVEIVYKKGVSPNQAISQLLKNYFRIEYNVRYRHDEILDMSPGKRGLVLLQLILHISNALHPILMDQPEENLDNRTISNELRQFISSKKLVRQIIMVTHDANLVVLTDAENVIVSNQDGQQINRENTKFRFEYVAGALENSFRLSTNVLPQGILYTCGIREHVCDILEGGELAFKKREEKYGFSNR